MRIHPLRPEGDGSRQFSSLSISGVSERPGEVPALVSMGQPASPSSTAVPAPGSPRERGAVAGTDREDVRSCSPRRGRVVTDFRSAARLCLSPHELECDRLPGAGVSVRDRCRDQDIGAGAELATADLAHKDESVSSSGRGSRLASRGLRPAWCTSCAGGSSWWAWRNGL